MWAPGLACVFCGTEKPRAPTGTRTLDRPARSLVQVLTVVSGLPRRLENVHRTKRWGATLSSAKILFFF